MAADAPDAPFDVVCLGETMAAFVPSCPGRLADVPSFERTIGGAESNVACALARAGHRARWVSRVGADGFGDHLTAGIAAAGVDVSAVRRDPRRPTGVYFRTAGDRDAVGDGAAETVYYRAGSAASALSPELVPRDVAWSGRVLHLSGITAALSPTCLALMRALTRREPGRPLVSFDVNHRAALWRDADPRVLADLAAGCDLVFVGQDEAAAVWGARDPGAIRAALPEPRVLVVKQGAAGAVAYAAGGPGAVSGPVGPGAAGASPTYASGGPGTASGAGYAAGGAVSRLAGAAYGAGGPGTAGASSYSADGPGAAGGPGAAPGLSGPPGAVGEYIVHMPAPTVEVVAHVGAGDAFAAGFLSATLRGLPLPARLRHGHLMAAAALTVPGDQAVPPTRAHADALAALDDAAWGRLRLSAGWTGRQAGGAPDGPRAADREVRT